MMSLRALFTSNLKQISVVLFRNMTRSSFDFKISQVRLFSDDKKSSGFAESESNIKLRLTPLQYEVCRMAGTEPPFSNEFWDHKEHGTYFCRVCFQNLFESTTKFDSGTGWPSFWAARENAVSERGDHSYGMFRIEVNCSRCSSHLGHLFYDGPKEGKRRYCINSAALDFEKKDEPSSSSS